MTALFFFSCSYFSPWIFYISLFNWLEENKAEKQEPKVNIWNAVAWKNLFLVFYEVAKGFMSWYVECDEYMHCWLKEEFCLRSKSSLCFMDNVPLSPQCAKCVTPLSLGTMFPMLRDCRACGRAVFRMPLLSQLRARGPVMVISGAGTPPSRGFRSLGSALPPFQRRLFPQARKKRSSRQKVRNMLLLTEIMWQYQEQAGS